MSTALDLDLATLVGELEDVPCESVSHSKAIFAHLHGGPATHYARITCEYCHMNEIRAYCGPFVAYLLCPESGVVCDCGVDKPAVESIRILGPVNGRAS